MPVSTAVAIFAAQDGFAPSHTMPDVIANAFTSVCAISAYPPPCSHAIAAPAAQPALTAPQYAESRPMPVFRWIVSRSDRSTARIVFSSPTFSSFA